MFEVWHAQYLPYYHTMVSFSIESLSGTTWDQFFMYCGEAFQHISAEPRQGSFLILNIILPELSNQPGISMTLVLMVAALKLGHRTPSSWENPQHIGIWLCDLTELLFSSMISSYIIDRHTIYSK